MPISGIEFHKESTNEWVSAENRNSADEDGLRLIGAGPSGVLTVMYADIPGSSWNAQRLALFTDKAHQLLTLRTPLSSLPNDHPYKTTDPDNYPLLYWDSGDLCSRTITISDVAFDSQLNRLSFVISRVH